MRKRIRKAVIASAAMTMMTAAAASAQLQAAFTEDITYRYDHAGRLVEETHSLNRRDPVLLCRNTYDELGRLSVSERGVSPSLTTSYTYNVRSWTTGISGPLYGETLHYEDLRAAGLPESSRRYGGDVSSAEWRASGDANVRSYDYEYDGLGRLSAAEYGEDGRPLVGYGTSYVYDMNGNVVSLQREGDLTYTSKGTVDDLTMTYDGNRLVGVSDTAADPQVYGSGDFRDCASVAQEYSYDLNGNLTCDLNAGIRRMTYDAAGYPSEVDRVDGAESYAYLSDGTKLGTVVTRPDRSEVRTDYRGNLVYEGGRLKYMLLDGGLVSMDGRAPEYVLFLKDHLGSTRVSAGPDGTVYQVNHYYPYGLSYATGTTATSQLPVDVGELVELPDLGVAPGVSEEISGPLPPASALRHPYRFLGNELNLERGRPVYDFKARQYDPALGRFQSVDPMSERYYGMSPYSYCGGSPVRYVDPDGKEKIISMIHSPKMNDPKYVNGKDGMKQLRRDQQNFRENRELISKMEAATDYKNVINLYAHGFEGGKGISLVYPGNVIIGREAPSLARYIKSNSTLVKEHGNDVVIVLNSCNTGNGPKSVGANLSLEMKEATVVAPTCSVTPNGQGVENGSWEVYVGGRVVRSVEATEKAYSALLKQLDLEYAKKYEGAK